MMLSLPDDISTHHHIDQQVPAIVARYAGQPNLAKAVEIAVRAQQNNDEAVESAVAIAHILEKVVLVSP